MAGLQFNWAKEENMLVVYSETVQFNVVKLEASDAVISSNPSPDGECSLLNTYLVAGIQIVV